MLNQCIPEIEECPNSQEKFKIEHLPCGSLGKLEEFAGRLAAIKGNPKPSLKNKVVILMAGDHGVTEEAVTPSPTEITALMVRNFLEGKAGINFFVEHVGARLVVVDMGVAGELALDGLVRRKIRHGTNNMAKGPAMTREEALRSIQIGAEIAGQEAQKGMDIVGLGEMGIGNTTPSSAIIKVLTNSPLELTTARGSGTQEVLQRKMRVIQQALEVNQPDPDDPIDVLAKVGSFEIGGLVGVILKAASLKIPVVIDGFISSAPAIIAACLEPKVKDYLFASHLSWENGHQIALDFLGLEPFIYLDMRLGEGTGSALGMFVLELAAKLLSA